MKYLQGTIGKLLILSINNNASKIKWYVDTAFFAHKDMSSHTGAFMSKGICDAFSKSINQKLNTRSLAEAELVGVNDVLIQVIWARYSLEAQG